MDCAEEVRNVSISEEIFVCKSKMLTLFQVMRIPEYFASTSRRRVNCRTSSDGIASTAIHLVRKGVVEGAIPSVKSLSAA
jgi:hypothetical protein